LLKERVNFTKRKLR